VTLALMPSRALAQTEISQYAAKFVCGKAEPVLVARGAYFTAINIHNPNEKEVTLRIKVAPASPDGTAPPSKFWEHRLGPDFAMELDCRLIQKRLGGSEAFSTGWVVVEVAGAEVDVVGVYTAEGGSAGVQTLHMERVPARKRLLR
jgi:hypothetical protein